MLVWKDSSGAFAGAMLFLAGILKVEWVSLTATCESAVAEREFVTDLYVICKIVHTAAALSRRPFDGQLAAARLCNG
jgi:hypothetical protein